MSWPRVHGFRLRRHHLIERSPRTKITDVAGDICGVQAQVMSFAELSLWARVKGLRQGDVERALWRDRALVKTWTVRGTLHLIPARELPMYVGGLLGAADVHDWSLKLPDLMPSWLRRQGLRPEDVLSTVDAIVDALADGPLTRKALADRVVDLAGPRVRPWIEHSWGGLVRYACLQGRVCFGPPDGRDVTFVQVRDWLPGCRPLPREEAEAALVRRYLRAYGPATPSDFAAWSGVGGVLASRSSGRARAMWARVQDDLAEISVEGRTAWLLADDLATLRRSTIRGGVRLLPSFDAYLLAHRDKSHLVDAAHYKKVYRKAGWLSPVVLEDGGAVATWRLAEERDEWRLSVGPFRRFPRASRAKLTEEVESLGRFLGKPCRIGWTPTAVTRRTRG